MIYSGKLRKRNFLLSFLVTNCRHQIFYYFGEIDDGKKGLSIKISKHILLSLIIIFSVSFNNITSVSAENSLPIADAGVDQIVDTLSTVTLDGSHSSDPDGDYRDNLIIGAPYYDNGQTNEGRAYVTYGSIPFDPSDWSAESNQAEANYGTTVSAAGDVNGDGYEDVIVGAPHYDNGQTNEGQAYLYYGSSTGLMTTPAWTVESDLVARELGLSVDTAGDLNGDGFDDVVVFINSGPGTGLVNIYYGSSSGLSATPSWTKASDQVGAQFGSSSSTAGDVNGDGYDDIIIGSFAYDNGQRNEGRAYVFHGSPSGLTETPAWIVESNLSNSWLGRSVDTAGDVNGDGYAPRACVHTAYLSLSMANLFTNVISKLYPLII